MNKESIEVIQSRIETLQEELVSVQEKMNGYIKELENSDSARGNINSGPMSPGDELEYWKDRASNFERSAKEWKISADAMREYSNQLEGEVQFYKDKVNTVRENKKALGQKLNEAVQIIRKLSRASVRREFDKVSDEAEKFLAKHNMVEEKERKEEKDCECAVCQIKKMIDSGLDSGKYVKRGPFVFAHDSMKDDPMIKAFGSIFGQMEEFRKKYDSQNKTND
jgi:chromosome segregation ATPase